MKIFTCLISIALIGSAFADLDARIKGILSQMSDQEKIDQLFYKTDGNARLGIPQFTGSDGPHGIGNKAKGWSSFPVNLAMSATWDPELIQRVGKAIALEQQSRGRHRLAGPTLDLLNDPRNGRAPETIGEDPFLGGRIVEGFLHGMNETAVFATIKHYNLNTYEAGRRDNNYQIDPRSLVEFWGAHWRRAVQEGGAVVAGLLHHAVDVVLTEAPLVAVRKRTRRRVRVAAKVERREQAVRAPSRPGGGS